MDLENKKEFIDQMVIQLRSDDRTKVSEASSELHYRIDATSTVKLLLPYISDHSNVVRQAIANILGERGNSEVIPWLVHLIDDEDPYVRATSIMALENFKEYKNELVNVITEKLKDSDKYVRSRAALCLGKFGAKKATPLLIEALTDVDSQVRGCAALSLGKIGAKNAVEPIIALLNDSNPNTRRLAVIALGRLKGEEALEAVLRAAKEEHWVVRYEAAEALGKIGDVRGLDILYWLRDNDKSGSPHDGDPLAEVARKAIKRIERLAKKVIQSD